MMKANHKEVHLCDPNVGHEQRRDCWCEPVRSYLAPGKDGNMVLVIEHNDTFTAAYSDVINARSAWPDWVTSLLNETGKGHDAD